MPILHGTHPSLNSRVHAFPDSHHSCAPGWILEPDSGCFVMPPPRLISLPPTALLQPNVLPLEQDDDTNQITVVAHHLGDSPPLIPFQQKYKPPFTRSKAQLANRKKTQQTREVTLHTKSKDPAKQKLFSEKEHLIRAKIGKQQKSRYRLAIDRFDSLMASLETTNNFTVNNVLTFISQLSLSGYTAHYIRGLAFKLMYHIKAEGVWDDVWQSRIIQQALRKAGPKIKAEDTRIPLNPGIIEAMSMVFDRDFDLYIAIALKAMIWMGTFCMTCLSEIAWEEGVHDCGHHTILLENIKIITRKSNPGLSVMFVTWKGASKQVTIFFKKYKVFEPVFNWLSQYLVLRPPTPLDAPLFVKQDSKPITQKFFASAFTHAVDHTLWYLLTMSTYSMRMGG